MDRMGAYVLGGAVSGALIAGIVAAFLSITALVRQTVFPAGSASAPSGSATVTVGGHERGAGTAAPPAQAAGPAGTLPAAASAVATADAPLNVIARRPIASAETAHRYGRRDQGRSRHPSRDRGANSSHPAPGHPGNEPAPSPAPSAAPTAVAAPQPDFSPPPDLASKPAGGSPGPASSPTGTPPGLATKPGGLPPGLANKPGGLPPGQAKKH